MANQVPYVSLLNDDEQRELEANVQIFLDEKTFAGCGGIQITDEIRVAIAAQACLLILGRETDYYPDLESILVYPAAYVANSQRAGEGGIVVESDQPRLGESWSSGQVVLSWSDVESGAADVRDGQNVVLHEFAHQLDTENPSGEGAPVLEHRSMYTAWARVLGHSYEKLLRDVDLHRRTVLDDYGATNPAEFFAVATETFFEKPKALKRKHPELYEQLRNFYRQDPQSRY